MNSTRLTSDRGHAAANHDVSHRNQYIVVTQVKSFRVIYFTTDEDYVSPREEDWCFVSSYQGELPAGMTLKNCWAWRFNGNDFVYAGEEAKKDRHHTLLDVNKKALRRILTEKIHLVRRPYEPSDVYGYELRRRKLKEARAFLEGDLDESSFFYLQATAQARNISVSNAAQLVIERAKKEKKMLVSTERIRERMALLIEQADNDAQLIGLRRMLLEDVYPELSREFRYHPINTTPINSAAPLPRHAVVQERARLTAVLREAVNRIRQNGHPYVYDDHVWQHKARLAAQYLQGSDSDVAIEVSPLLEAASREIGKPVREIAQLWLLQVGIWSRKLVETELAAREIETKIEAAISSDDFSTIEKMAGAIC
jgi:hypothetical protein